MYHHPDYSLIHMKAQVEGMITYDGEGLRIADSILDIWNLRRRAL